MKGSFTARGHVMDGVFATVKNKRVFSTFLLAAILLAWAGGTDEGVCAARPGRSRDIQFHWACVAMTTGGGEPRWEKITQSATLEAGAQIKMYLRLGKPSAIYVIHQNAAGELNLLFPLRFFGPGSEAQKGEAVYIPGGDGWLGLQEGAGEENIFLLAGTDRLIRLEELLGEYAVADGVKKRELAGEVVREIQSLRTKHRDLSTFAERPITMAGRVRGIRDPGVSTQPDVALLADEITAGGFFSRTITIQRK